MADGTAIEWTDATWNPITGCSLASPGCTNCYAMKLAGTRLQHHASRAGLTEMGKAGPVWNGVVRFNQEWLDQPLRWTRPRMIFVCAHGDLFHEAVPDEWIDRVFEVMERCSAPNGAGHIFQILTKRAQRMRQYMQARLARRVAHADAFSRCPTPAMRDSPAARWAREAAQPAYYSNIWAGVSAEDQTRFDERAGDLEHTPAAVRWFSFEPLLGGIDAAQRFASGAFHWAVVGGESGPGARPMHPDWARSLRDQCETAGVAFHFKQWGAWKAYIDRDQDDPDWRQDYTSVSGSRSFRFLNLAGGYGFHGERLHVMQRIGKKHAGRLLDGIQHDGVPA